MQERAKRTPDAHTSERIFYSFILASFIFALTVIPIRVIFDEAYRSSTEYRIILFQLSTGVVFLRLPRLLSRLLRISIPDRLSVAYMLFIWFSMFLGEFALFYYRVPVWDILLHLYSAALLTLLGLSLPRLLSGVEMNAQLTALLALGFSVLVGVLWEIYEFSFDGILGLNMQKFATPGTGAQKLAPLVGRSALTDTMTDLITDLSGSLAVAIWGGIRIKKHGHLPERLTITRTHNE